MSSSRFSITRLTAIIAVTAVWFAFSASAVAGSDREREQKQAELDAACESAREQKLVPIRQQLVQKCVDEQQFDTQSECEAYFADYGARAGGRAALFYDLPPCVEAFEYANSERSGG